MISRNTRVMIKRVNGWLFFIENSKIKITNCVDAVFVCDFTDYVDQNIQFDGEVLEIDKAKILVTRFPAENVQEEIKELMMSAFEELEAKCALLKEKEAEIANLKNQVKSNSSFTHTHSKTKNPIVGSSLLNPRVKKRKTKDSIFDSDD